MVTQNKQLSFDEVIAALKAVHARFPQLRVGQMICNSVPPALNNDPYYLADSELANNLRKFNEVPAVSSQTPEE